MDKVYKALDEVITSIKDSKEYIEVLEIKRQMEKNSELIDLIEKVKDLQKKYVKKNYDSKIKEELDEVEDKLNSIPIYNIYLEKLKLVNEKIDYVKDSLNEYFDDLLNKSTS